MSNFLSICFKTNVVSVEIVLNRSSFEENCIQTVQIAARQFRLRRQTFAEGAFRAHRVESLEEMFEICRRKGVVVVVRKIGVVPMSKKLHYLIYTFARDCRPSSGRQFVFVRLSFYAYALAFLVLLLLDSIMIALEPPAGIRADSGKGTTAGWICWSCSNVLTILDFK